VHLHEAKAACIVAQYSFLSNYPKTVMKGYSIVYNISAWYPLSYTRDKKVY
jgi:hypothetical protein